MGWRSPDRMAICREEACDDVGGGLHRDALYDHLLRTTQHASLLRASVLSVHASMPQGELGVGALEPFGQ